MARELRLAIRHCNEVQGKWRSRTRRAASRSSSGDSMDKESSEHIDSCDDIHWAETKQCAVIECSRDRRS